MHTSLLHKHGTPQERIGNVTDLTLMTFSTDPTTVLPSLTLLSHRVRVLPMDASSPAAHAREHDSAARRPRQPGLRENTVQTAARLGPVDADRAHSHRGGFTVVNGEWGVSDVIVNTASPAEVEGRLRLVTERVTTYSVMPNAPANSGPEDEDGLIRSGDLVVDTNGYTANLRGVPIDLAYKEFELLKYLVQHPGRVFTRAQLLQEVWGYDYYGGTRTVDVHVRRLRAKLGGEYEHLIGTVRNVGYRFDPPEEESANNTARETAEMGSSTPAEE